MSADVRPCPCGGHEWPQPPGTLKGWGGDEGPAAVLGFAGGGWVDHPYRVCPEVGRTTWVAEPYRLGADAFCDFATLAEAGFRVWVSPAEVRHLRGGTIAVLITRAVPA